MNTFTHAISASFIAYTAVEGLNPQALDTTLLAASILTPTLLDLDHIAFIALNPKFYMSNATKQVFHNARSPMHEVFGAAVIATLGLLFSFIDDRLSIVITISYIVHIAEDMLIGKAIPMNPFDKTLIQLFKFKIWHKYVIDFLIIIIFSILWLVILRGTNLLS